MNKLVVLVIGVGIFLTACGQGTPMPTPTSTPMPAPTLTPILVPTPTPLSVYDERFVDCYDDQVLPFLRRVGDDLKGVQYALENRTELATWLERLRADADVVQELLMKECPLPDNPNWRESRLLMKEAMGEFRSGTASMLIAMMASGTSNLDEMPEHVLSEFKGGVAHINKGVELLDEALELLSGE